MTMKKTAALLLILALLLTAVTASAATAVNGYSTNNTRDILDSVPTFKFEHRIGGIGCGTCPVYAAPDRNAFRAANGKASCATNADVDVGGFSNGWLLVRYSTNNGGTRVGWIPPEYVKKVKTSMQPRFTRIEQTAEYDFYVSDNNYDPYNSSSFFAKLTEGEDYWIIGRYNYYQYDLWYIEFYIGNQLARGFIPVD